MHKINKYITYKLLTTAAAAFFIVITWRSEIAIWPRWVMIALFLLSRIIMIHYVKRRLNISNEELREWKTDKKKT